MFGQRMKTHWRAVDIFTDAANQIVTDCKQIAAEHSAKGLLGSGSTAKRSVAAFEVRSRESLKQILGEVANVVDHRGRRWRREMAEIDRALEEHIRSAPGLLADNFRLARLRSAGAQEAANQLVEWSAQDLRKDFLAFRDGWTSPRSRPWRERYAAVYAIILILIGALVGQSATWASKKLNDDSSQTSALTSTAAE